MPLVKRGKSTEPLSVVKDTSAAVRKRALCGLARAGTLHVAERYAALPGLLATAEDQQSDEQTPEWTYQALKEISGVYELPHDPVAWRRLLAEVDLL